MTIVSPMGQLRPVFADKNGKRLSGGKVYTYEPGTLTPKATYTDALNLIPNTNPIILNESGEADIYLDGGYRMQVFDRYGVLIQDVDNFRTWASGIPAESILYGSQDLKQFNTGVEAAIEDRYTKAETYSKPEIDTSLIAIAGGHKAYQTFAAAQAAQATLPLNSIVEVTNDGANNGTYQWNGTTLTKSAYDPLTQAKTYTDTKITKENFFKTLANKSAKARVKDGNYNSLSVSSPVYLGIALTVSTVNNPSEIVVGADPLRLTNAVLKNTSQSVSKFTVSRPSGVILDYNLMPEDEISGATLTTKWEDFDVSNIVLSNPVVMSDTNGFRIKFIVDPSSANVYSIGNEQKNVIEMTGTIATMPATEMSAYNNLALSYQSESSNRILQVKVSNAFLAEKGYALTSDDAKAFATQLIPVLNLKLRLSTPKLTRTGIFSSLLFTNGTTSLTYGEGITLTASLVKQVQTLNSVVTLRDELTRRINKYDVDSSFANFQRLQDVSKIGENSNIISSPSSVELVSDRVISAFSASIANNAVGEIVIKSNKNQFKIPVRGGDVFSDGKLTTSWKDYSFDASKITSSVVVRANDYVRIQLLLSDLPATSSGISNANIVDVSGLFTSASQQNIEATEGLAISSHNTQSMQMKIPLSYLSSLGYESSINSEVLRFVTEICTAMKFKLRTYSNFETLSPAHLLNLPAGSYTIEASSGVAFSLELRDIKTVSNDVKDKGFETFSTSVKNTSGYVITDGVIALKVSFPQGLVASDAQIIVTDFDGNAVSAQFAPDRNPNLSKAASDGYWADNSFKNGVLYVIDSLPINAVKTYKIYVYQQEVNAATLKANVANDPSDAANYQIVTYNNIALQVGKTADKLLNKVTKNGANFLIDHHCRFAVATVADPSSTPTAKFGGVRSKPVIRSGNVFTDIELTVNNQAFQKLAADSIRLRIIYRLFKDGTLRVLTYFDVLKDIPKEVLYSIISCWSDTTTLVKSFSTTDQYVYMESSTQKAHFRVNMLEGDIHRDGVDSGARRYTFTYMAGSVGSNFDFRFGWNDTVGSQSSLKWKVEKGHAWVFELVFAFGKDFTDGDHMNTVINNEPIGFVQSGLKSINSIHRDVLNKAAEYSLDLMDFLHKNYSLANTPTSTYRQYSGLLMRDYIDGTDNFNTIYANFIQMMKNRWGQDYAVNYGNSYLTQQATGNYFMMQFESRVTLPHIQWLYLHALKIGDTAKVNELKALMGYIAPVLAARALNYGGISLSPVTLGEDKGNSNGTASGMRYLAIAIHMGLDTEGGMLNAFNLCENHLHSKDWWMPVYNQLSDGMKVNSAHDRYLHYAVYAQQMYLHACGLLGRDPLHNVAQFAMNAFTGSGQASEHEYCISESRRGSRNTVSFALNCLIAGKTLGSAIASERLIDRLISHGGVDETGRPGRLDDYYFSLDPTIEANWKVIGTDGPFTCATLVDVWFGKKFGLI